MNLKAVVIAIVLVGVVAAAVAYMYIRPFQAPGAQAPRECVVGEVKVGAILPLSGPLAETGKDLQRGVEFALEEINSRGIASLGGAKVKVVYADSRGDPSVGASEAERLITGENVVALFGAYLSAVTKTASDVAERYGVPFLNPDSSSPTLTERGYRWFFRVTPHDGMFSVQFYDFLDYLKSSKGAQISTIGILYEDSEFGQSTAKVWRDLAPQRGYRIVVDVQYKRGAPDLTAELLRIKSANPDVLFVAAYVSDAILIQKTLKAIQWTPKLIVAQDAGYIEPAYIREVGSLGYYVTSREVFNWDLYQVNPRLKEVNDRYRAKYGVDLNGNSARDYTGVMVLAKALDIAGKTACPTDLARFREALRSALANLTMGKDEIVMPWNGVKFDEKGQNTLGRGIIVQMMNDGKYYTVFPREFATRDVAFPMPPYG